MRRPGASDAEGEGIMRRRLVVLGLVLAAALAGFTRPAHANSCNLYSPQRWGEIREGCSLTIFTLPEIDPQLPTIQRDGVELVPAIVEDQITLKVTYEHYKSPTSCDTYLEYENKPFDRFVVSWPDLKGGDEIRIDDHPYVVVVPGPGDCGIVDPFFYCQDGIQFCDDTYPPDENDTNEPDDVDLAGCSAASGGTGWLAAIGVLAVLSCIRRSRTRIRRSACT
jgi:hypothetical protein